SFLMRRGFGRRLGMKLSLSHKSALERLLSRLSRSQKILVVGDVGLDRYTVGAVDRISPEAPVPIVRVESEVLKLGLAANVADNICALSSEPWLVGVVGVDRVASDFRKVLRKQKITDRHLITDAKRRTVLKERIVSDRQQLLRVDYEDSGQVSSQVSKELAARFASLVAKVDVVVLEDYAKGMLDPSVTKRIFSLARKYNKKVLVDPNARSPLRLYEGASLLTPNTKEAEALSECRITDVESLQMAGERILRKTGAAQLIITRGKEGMAIFEKGRRAMSMIPTYAREVYDVSGAGDTVISVLALCIGVGASLEDAARLANIAAAIEVSKRGTATVSLAEIREALASWA
ncbi:MAG: D-glycero-beta-D-manno-heptose-7-phosphate kinase, partial [Bdellovibrionales bacterium]|nr:D-glycero-beta-D-manno-heptose-7-phosphate kinase [Bdellovibrionales bacterium]